MEYLSRRTAKQLVNALRKVPLYLTQKKPIIDKFLLPADQLHTHTLRKVIFLYARGGFVVRHAMMDMEFEKVKNLVLLVEVNTTAARETWD